MAYRYLPDGGGPCAEITYSELDERARRVAAWIQSRDVSGQPIPLIFDAGFEFLEAFYGCLYSGNIAVPLSLPRLREGMSRTLAAIADAEPPMLLVADSASERLHREFPKQDSQPKCAIVPFAAARNAELSWREPAADPAGIVVLQYTSGSTSSPKGVEITNRNLLHNISLMAAASRATADSVGVNWLPHFHDMGLIGGILMPLYVGFPVTLMSPLSFLRRPIRWLETISTTRATISGGPNFGYEHCLRSNEDLQHVDLSSWATAFTGAEPIRPETISRFCAKFEHAGFRKEAFFPCYGLAEATLMVSGQHWGEASEQQFSRISLSRGRAQEAESADDSMRLVSSGPVLPGHRVLIVDPETRVACEAGSVGEVWVDGESVGSGYWGRSHETAEVFRASLAGREDTSFMRTGDLGFLWQGHLFVAGRLKEILIIRGTNFYPQDIERTLEARIPALRAGFGAAFSVEDGREEKVVVVYELDGTTSAAVSPELEAIVSVLSREFGLQLHVAALVARNRIPRTTSGKIKRQQCRSDFIAGKLPIVAEWRNPAEIERSATSFVAPEIESVDPVSADLVASIFKTHLADLLGVDRFLVTDDKTVFDLGIDSLLATRLQNRIEQSLKIRLEASRLLEASTVGEIIAELVAQAKDKSRRQSDEIISATFERVARLSDDEIAQLLSAGQD